MTATERATRERLALSHGHTREPAALAGPGLTADPDWVAALDITAAVTEAVRIGPAQAADVLPNLGVIRPLRGNSFVILSTGIANYGQPGALPPERGTDFPPIDDPEGDEVTLKLTLTVPPGANRVSFQYNFLSAEAPDFNTGEDNIFNDTFSLELIEPATEPRDFKVATVNHSSFILSSDSRAKGTGFDIYSDNPAGVDTAFNGGFPDAGLTDFQTFSAPVTPGVPLTMRFTIKDNGDGILDSAVLIDAVQFSSIETIDPNAPDAAENLLDAKGSLVKDVDALVTHGVPVRGVVADGATTIVLRMKVPDTGSVDFSVPDDEHHSNGTLSALTAAPGAVAAAATTAVVAAADGQRYALAVYRAPASFNRGGPDGPDAALIERATTVTATFRNSDREPVFDATVNLQIRRPPVVLASGLWSRESDWRPASLDAASRDNPLYVVNDARFAITRAEDTYLCNPEQLVWPSPKITGTVQVCDGQPHPTIPKISCGRDTAPRTAIAGPPGLVGLTIRAALDNTRRLGIAATKADVVAHGTGGIRVRQYIASTAYTTKSNLGSGDVNRLITVNTPHFGATIAAQIAEGRLRVPATGLESYTCGARAGENPLEQGDIDALARAALALPATPVPSHAIVGTGGIALNGLKLKDLLPKLLNRKTVYSNTAARVGLANALFSTSFNKCDHDLFSDVLSQKGGLRGDATSSVAMTDESGKAVIDRDDPDSDYFRSLRHPMVNATIKQLLNTRIDDNTFDTFPASTLAQRCDPQTGLAAVAAGFARDSFAPARSAPTLAATGTLRIVSPANGDAVTAGGTLIVRVASDDGFVPEGILVFIGSSVTRNNAPPFTTTVTVPPDELGALSLTVIAFDAQDNLVVTDDVIVNVTTNATLNTVHILTQDPILYGEGLTTQLHVVGTYSDDITRDITAGVGTVYLTSSRNIVAVSDSGAITAVGSGTATVIAKNGPRQDSVSVVVKVNARPIARAGADVSLLCVPPGDNVPVQLDASASSDVEGDALSFTWLEDGVEVASGATPLVALPAGVHTLELVVSDGISTPVSDTVLVNVLPDVEPPVLTIVGDSPKRVECSTPYTDDGASATDACDGDLTASIEPHVRVDTSVVGNYGVDYRVADRAGLVAVAARAVSVTDTTPPVLALAGANPTTAECGVPFTDDGAVASDLCDGSLTAAITRTPHVDIGAVGNYSVDYQVTDHAGLVATATRAVTVADHTPPALSLVGANPGTAECGVPFTDDGATASDLCDGSLDGAITRTGNVDPATVGDYAVQYQVHDRAGLTATATRAVSVADHTPPALSVVGANPAVAECGASYTDQGATASDLCDGSLTGAITREGHVDAATVGSYAVRYQVHDRAGLVASATRAVSVADSTPPVLSLVGANPAVAECGLPFTDPGATAADVCDGSLNGAITREDHVDAGTVGSYAVRYQVHDRAGLVAGATRLVSVADTTPPLVSLVGANPAIAECGLPFADPGATASDLCSGDLTRTVVTASHVNTSVVGGYTVDYQVHDGAGLLAAASRAVSVADRTPPRLTIVGANPAIVECATRYQDRGATAADLCDGDVTGAVSTVSHVNTRAPGRYLVDYRVSDRSGQAAAASRAVVVADRTAPDVDIAPMRTLTRDDRYRTFELSDCATAVDACSGKLNIDRVGDIVAIHSDEPDRSSRFDPDHDIVILSHSKFKLREQSNVFGNGRVYEIELTVPDELGNAAVHSCFIGVKAPFRQGAPVNDGRVFTVRPRH